MRSTSAPTCSALRRLRATGRESRARNGCPSPAIVGATKSRSLSTRSASRNAVARVGPPSSRSDWTPSPPSRASSSSSGPETSSSAEPFGSGPRPNASRRGCATAPTSRAVSSRVVRADRAHPDGDRVRGRPQLVDAAAALLAGHPARAGNGDAAVERDRELQRHERPPGGDPRPPRLVLARGPRTSLRARPPPSPSEGARDRRGPRGSGRAIRRRPARRLPAARPPCTAASSRGARRAPSSRRASRRARGRRPPPARPPRRAGRPCARASPRRRPRRPRRRRRRRRGSAVSSRARARRARARAGGTSCQGLDEAAGTRRQVLRPEDRRPADDQVGAGLVDAADVVGVIPPSTWRWIPAGSSARRRSSLGIASSMNSWPEKPGWMLMQRTRSKPSAAGTTSSTVVSGLNASPTWKSRARAPSRRPPAGRRPPRRGR